MPLRACLLLLLLAACEPKEVLPDRTDTDDTTFGECAAPVPGYTLTFTGTVVDGEGKPARNTTLVLENRSPPAEDFGTATTDRDGRFTLVADNITNWPGCWLVVLDFWLVAESDAGTVERDVNRQMYTAIGADESTIDLTDRPLVLEP